MTRLHPDDIDAIADKISENLAKPHYCRFADISTEDMKDTFAFMSTFKSVSEKVGRTVLIIIVSTVTAGIMGLIALGFWSKVNS